MSSTAASLATTLALTLSILPQGVHSFSSTTSTTSSILNFTNLLTSCSYTATCNANGIDGVCVSITNNCCSGTITSGLCPGSSDMKCCTNNPCNTPNGAGICLTTSACSSRGGVSYSGYCTGPSNIQCCVENNENDIFGDNPYYYSNWCNGASLEYLDDANCVKKFPSHYDREWSCPVVYDASSDQFDGYISANTPLKDIEVDVTTLAKFVDPKDANICLIVLKRTTDGKLLNKYYCNSADSRDTPYETWSSSKIFAMANAAGKSREECSASGLTSFTTGNHGKTALGDLATIIASYDHTMGYSSNSLSSYFHDIGWRTRINDLVTGSWLNQPTNSLGGNYGEATPSDLGFTMTCSDGTKCTLEKESPPVYPNSLSMLSASELTRRISLFRDLDSSLRFPQSKWEDMQEILYGAGDSSTLFPEVQWGGMTSCTSIFVQSALNMTKTELDAHGKWRIFSKLGAGYSSSRGRGEVMNNAYTCLPVLDSSGNVMTNMGYEFVLSVRGSVVQDYTLAQAEEKVHAAVVNAIKALMTGEL